MEEYLLTLLTGAVTPPWNYVLAGVGLALLVGPRLAQLPGVLHDIRSRRRALILEKERLEIAKLRYEIAALKKQHGLSELEAPEPELKSAEPSERTVLKPERTPAPVGVPPRWLSRYPRLGKTLLAMLQGIVGFFLFIFGISVVTVPLLLISDQTGPMGASDIGMLVFAPLMYGLLTWGFYRAFKKIRQWKARIGKAEPRAT